MSSQAFSSAEFNLLSEEKRIALKLVEKGNNILITGGAGTGKSFLLNYIRKNFKEKNIAITASTGIAAVNISGSTIHSWLGIGLANGSLEQIIQNIRHSKFAKLRRKIRATNIIAIDEISMISAATFDIISEVLKAIREDNRPFGGLQMILFGDFLQLPPVSNDKNGPLAELCFKSDAWIKGDIKIVDLKEIFRQNERRFIDLLNNLRFGRIDEKDATLLESRMKVEDKNISLRPTILTSHNYKADEINVSQLKNIVGEEKSFCAEYSGDPQKIEFLKKNCIANDILRLRIGAQVMMIKNTLQKDGIINGSLGIVRGFSKKKSYPIVEFMNNSIHTIAYEEWAVEKFDDDKKEFVKEASIAQIPLILSWAITIHKSQGLTLDKISCDLSEIFSYGQAYVALSRARNINGIFIKSINFKKIKANPQAIEFYENIC